MSIDKIEVRRIISAIKFRDGGAAMLAAEDRNQNIDIIGKNESNPLEIKMLRVWVISYCIFAKENREDEQRP